MFLNHLFDLQHFKLTNKENLFIFLITKALIIHIHAQKQLLFITDFDDFLFFRLININAFT